ncbi:MAG: glycoside hydrolase family 16 protein, partial [Thermomicrobiales bacterium]
MLRILLGRAWAIILGIACLAFGVASAWDVATPIAQGQGADPWKLVWGDEFDGKELDRSKWDRDLGNGFFNYDANTWISGWGNGELQYYTREPENAFVKDGTLHLRALKESLHNCGY